MHYDGTIWRPPYEAYQSHPYSKRKAVPEQTGTAPHCS